MPIKMTTQELWTLRHVDEPGHMESRAFEEIRTQDERRLELSKQVMRLEADLSTSQSLAAEYRGRVEQLYRDAHGHNKCWRNVERLFEQFGFAVPRDTLPPPDEALQGCITFWEDVYACRGARWPDFVTLGPSACKTCGGSRVDPEASGMGSGASRQPCPECSPLPRLLEAIEKLNEVVNVAPLPKNEHGRIVQLLEAINYVLGMAHALRMRTQKETKE